MSHPKLGQLIADEWAKAVARYEPPDFLDMWKRGLRHGVNARGESTRQIFGLLTPTELTDDELFDRETR